ncbi:hypothetical protein DERP_006569 [Dermatophagoides pteronyssinus]|uniref:Uncharacterized protein n=1 Tax=Dermatophagoides pteronyssinus TaxID=6956 RepID=A0ABQ8IQV2_DERPT|nr:hypothetical protein DERP_006569 [Dermatophagoides pteronyssinus]
MDVFNLFEWPLFVTAATDVLPFDDSEFDNKSSLLEQQLFVGDGIVDNFDCFKDFFMIHKHDTGLVVDDDDLHQ